MEAQGIESCELPIVQKDKMGYALRGDSSELTLPAGELGPKKVFDFGAIGSAIENSESMATTAAGTESYSTSAFSPQGFGMASFGMDSWNPRKLGHQGSGSSLNADAPVFAMGLQDVHEDLEMSHSLSTEPVKITTEAFAGHNEAFLGPPGLLSAENLSSVGSKDHGTGSCKPCAWFWKPGSCTNGKDCCHCHLCPAGEIKSRKKDISKKQSPSQWLGSAEPAFLNEQVLKEFITFQVPQGLCPSPPGVLGLPSVGSSLHASGQCRPCAWFYKSQGCSNAKDCKHCHLCPEGELKIRKKNYQEKHKDTTEPQVFEVEGVSESQYALPPGLPILGPAAGEESVGSEKHATRECRPCAWYWRPNSCSNGKDCLHCHLCDKDEIKRRKKVKVESMRSGPKAEDEVSSNDDAPQPAVSSSPKSRGKSSTPPPPPCIKLQEDMADSEEIDQANLSSGSTLHALGKCKPCAWHWKPGGCTNGAECCHCHLCPPGEMKGRRKAKETAMRAGALLPANATPTRPMHVLKIFKLL